MSSTNPWRISADTGGTFTDCHAISPEGIEMRVKVLSSGCLRAMAMPVQDNPKALELSQDWGQPEGFFDGFLLRVLEEDDQEYQIVRSEPEMSGQMNVVLDRALENMHDGSVLIELSSKEAAPVLAARLITHTSLASSFPPLVFRLATTRATNALLENKGTSVALFITQGFADLLRIGDQRRKHLFALQHEDRQIYYQQVHEVRERLDATGAALRFLDEAELRRTAQIALSAGIHAAAVSFLHSDLNPSHEKTAQRILLEEGFTHVSLSSELAPFIKILPRAQSTVANAYLTGPVNKFLSDVRTPLGSDAPLFMMTSSASLEPAGGIHPKDLLLSGPAAGVLGALNAAQDLGYHKVITFDMGGTSTDVARLDGVVGYRFQQTISGLTLMSPAVAIETVAAGGGSICAWTPSGLAVGPHSAGSDPGPACYGKGGPLTVTDVNLLLGRFDAAKAPIPLQMEASRQKLHELRHEVQTQSGRTLSDDDLLHTLLAIANQHMADAIRKISVLEGYAPEGYALLAFGGAGPQHACDIAELLNIKTILAPHHAGILSAVGLQQAKPERFAQKQILKKLADVQDDLRLYLSDLAHEAARQLLHTTGHDETPHLRNLAELRLSGQDSALQFEFTHPETLQKNFTERYERLFGYPPPATKTLELVSLRVIATASGTARRNHRSQEVVENLKGPKLVQDGFSTLIVSAGWDAENILGHGWVLKRTNPTAVAAPSDVQQSQDVIRHRLHGIVEDMGALLRRTALSTNIRERLDFSCALLTCEGQLLTSAPHIPVHLGALGVCVREVMRQHPLQPGDTWVTNHPAFGGSHLPDITLITPVYNAKQQLLGIVANRAHHAEIGGIAPGSMPANATMLHEEGVVIAPRLLIREGVSYFQDIRDLLTNARHPTRSVDDNIADLHAQLAANRMGVERLLALADEVQNLKQIMDSILNESRSVMQHYLPDFKAATAQDALDDNTPLCVKLTLHQTDDISSGKRHLLRIDFSGSGSQHAGNLNATSAIIHSAVLYVLRLALQKDLPLNEGLLKDVNIILPEGSFLNPDFSNEELLPAVVGGNVEVSQRVVALLIEALDLQAASQGTMNNFLFGNDWFGYYETICGGMGAGPGYHGASAQHSHMTNTAITDAEVIERRYPIRLHSFSIRPESGGKGTWDGGNGIIREMEFLQPLTVSLLTQHRHKGPRGKQGGLDGQPGIQQLTRKDAHPETLPASVTFDAAPGDRVRIETPGGGGWGKAEPI